MENIYVFMVDALFIDFRPLLQLDGRYGCRSPVVKSSETKD